MGVKPPPNADGRVLAEVLIDPPAKRMSSCRQAMQERGVTLRDGDALTCTSRHDAEKLPTLRSGIKSKEEVHG